MKAHSIKSGAVSLISDDEELNRPRICVSIEICQQKNGNYNEKS